MEQQFQKGSSSSAVKTKISGLRVQLGRELTKTKAEKAREALTDGHKSQ